tara:strand:+ start:63 stop:302 length:240 start_codon:yes stop_codon:yes gene_type:complete
MGVKDWIQHLQTDVDSATEGVQVANIYPGAGTEGVLVLIAVVIWIGWHVITGMQEEAELKKLAKRKPSSNAWKSNVTDG